MILTEWWSTVVEQACVGRAVMSTSKQSAFSGWRVAVLLLVVADATAGVAFQRNPTPTNPSPNYSTTMGTNNSNSLPRSSSLDDPTALREMEEKRGKALNTERQRMIIRDANQVVQAAADLQVSVNKGIEGAAREEQAKRAEAIEKLARDLKERMKGSR
jgi:hypothetical protein